MLVIKLDSPNVKVNSLGKALTAEFEVILKELETNANVKSAVLISAKPGCFVAGADISMLEQCQSAEEARTISHEAQLMFNRMEKSAKPIVSIEANFNEFSLQHFFSGVRNQWRVFRRWI